MEPEFIRVVPVAARQLDPRPGTDLRRATAELALHKSSQLTSDSKQLTRLAIFPGAMLLG